MHYETFLDCKGNVLSTYLHTELMIRRFERSVQLYSLFYANNGPSLSDTK